jgi:hypothetical protein
MKSVIILIVVAFWALLTAAAGDNFITIPVKANVLNNVAVTKADAEAAIKEANKLLKQAKIKLVFDKDKNFKNGVGDGGNNDDKIDNETEYDKVRKNGNDELKKKKADGGFDGKGFKIYFADKFFGINAIGGAAGHDPAKPVVLIKKGDNTSPPISTNEEMGNNIAHEFCHTFTLGAGHLIDPTAPPPDNTADANGHHRSSTDNLMWGITNDRMTGKNELTEEQIKEIRKKENAGSKAITKDSNMNLIEDLQAMWTDDAGDIVGSSYIDLFNGDIFCDIENDSLILRINLNGLFPDSGSLELSYELCFNTDHDSLTGITLGIYQGIDYIIYITLTGHYPFTDTSGAFVATVYEVASEQHYAQPEGQINRIPTFIESDVSPSTQYNEDQIKQSIPFSLLGTLAEEVPYGIISYEFSDGDTIGFDNIPWHYFSTDPPHEPSLDMIPLQGMPGDTIELQGNYFSNMAPVYVYLDDDSLSVAITDISGSFSHFFNIPELPPDFYFITARDTSGYYDFTVLKIGGYQYLPGDANMYNGGWPPSILGADATFLINFFRGSSVNRPCLLDGFWASADVNGDCNIIGSDVTRLINYMRGSGSILYCPDYEPAWHTPAELPPTAPEGWPNCEVE